MDKTRKYDRALQLEILNALIDCAPNYLNRAQERALIEKFDNYDHFVACMLYLEMHGLVSTPFVRSETMAGVDFIFNASYCNITEKGIDFLLDDGGLSAILKVQTVRLHNDTIVALEDIIRVANISEDQKKGLISKLRELPGDAIKHLALQLLTQGVLNLPNALRLIQTTLQ
ncbi:hypothetical protein KWH94_06965 [Citrobacter cronae]|uniref:hypothetical protein n=1 Tax=Citrobacter cronae TaxID=1748967 RepID=UPI0021CE465B|nr:hypothetical protein [Citrobacter cronae]MCU6182864.1 hypothetical protein [Citrobacter cronae]